MSQHAQFALNLPDCSIPNVVDLLLVIALRLLCAERLNRSVAFTLPSLLIVEPGLISLVVVSFPKQIVNACDLRKLFQLLPTFLPIYLRCVFGPLGKTR